MQLRNKYVAIAAERRRNLLNNSMARNMMKGDFEESLKMLPSPRSPMERTMDTKQKINVMKS